MDPINEVSFKTINLDNKSNSDGSDSDKYVDLEEIIKEQDKDKNNIYQIQLSNDEMMIKLVGKEFYVPDVIIMENFGPDNKLSLYSCLYEENDFNLKTESGLNDTKDFLHPLLKLIERNNDTYTIFSIVVKFKELAFNIKITDFELFIIFNKNEDDCIYTYAIEKNIDSKNIIEKILEYYNLIIDTKEYLKKNQ
jgi:hypothetical protein